MLQRRTITLRILAASLGGLATLATWELATFLWPIRDVMDNPWYLATGEGLESDAELRFVRAPNIEWTGPSRGDLAMRAGGRDPYVRTVTFRTDFEGFRNSEDLAQADIVFLGDSFTEAGNIPEEETFVARVGRGLGVTVRNLGRAGYSAPSELVVLERYALKNRPRLVIWQIAEANDLVGALRYQQWLDGGLQDNRETEGKPTRVEAWKRRSPSYRVFEMLREPIPWPLGGTFLGTGGDVHEVRFLPHLPGRRHEPLRHPGWPLTVKAIESGARTLRSEGIELVVLLIPMKLRVMGPYVRFRRAELEVDGKKLVFEGSLPEGWALLLGETLAFHLHRLCARLGVAFVDATPSLMREAAGRGIVYLPLDTHLSSRGHAVLSELLLDSLRRDSAIPSKHG